MKLFIKLGLLITCLCAMSPLLHAELLVIKRTDKGFAPLDANDGLNKAALANIFLDYEWPMVIANTALTKAEQDALLTAGKSYAEEDFIRAKVKMIDPNYDVVFIPTSLYELFALSEYSKTAKNLLKSIVEKKLTAEHPRYAETLETMVRKALGDEYSPPAMDENIQSVSEKVFDAFRTDNDYYYPHAFFYINNALATALFAINPELKDNQDANALVKLIQAESNKIAAYFINNIHIGNEVISKRGLDPQNSAAITAHGTLAKVISLEYEARTANKALLLRGASPIEITKGLEGGKLKLMMFPTQETTYNKSFEQIAYFYKGKAAGQGSPTLQPYSLSFGNSLFAGFVRDPTACAYLYLQERGGYALFVDKKYHIKNLYTGPHKSLDLFFIAPLAPLAALFERGEYFHSRTKAIDVSTPFTEDTPPWKYRYRDIAGCTASFIDPAGFLTIKRDPLVHTEIVLRYLAKNMHIITKGDESGLIDEEKKVYEDKLKQSHQQAAHYYKAIQTLEPFAVKASQKVRKKVAEKKKEMASLPRVG